MVRHSQPLPSMHIALSPSLSSFFRNPIAAQSAARSIAHNPFCYIRDTRTLKSIHLQVECLTNFRPDAIDEPDCRALGTTRLRLLRMQMEIAGSLFPASGTLVSLALS